jgi:hypothetical protein
VCSEILGFYQLGRHRVSLLPIHVDLFTPKLMTQSLSLQRHHRTSSQHLRSGSFSSLRLIHPDTPTVPTNASLLDPSAVAAKKQKEKKKNLEKEAQDVRANLVRSLSL